MTDPAPGRALPLLTPAAPGLRPATRLDRSVLAGVGLATLAGAFFALWAPLADLTFRSTDDAYYYFGVARNVVLGHGFTFDRLHPTNGFHPLWMALLLPVTALAGGGLETTLRFSYVLVALVTGAVLWMAYVAVATHAGRGAGLAAALALLAPPFLNPVICGLETGLLLLVLFTLLWAARRHDLLAVHAGPGRDLALGVLLGLLMLSRLDSVFLAVAVYAVPAARWLAGGAARPPLGALVLKLARVGAVVGLLLAPYFAWNALTFGHLMPVSGSLKTSFPEVSMRMGRLVTYHARYGQLLLAAASAALVWTRLRRPPDSREPHAVLVAFWAGCALHFLHTVLYMGFGVHWWHFALYVPLALAGAGLVLSQEGGRAARPGLVTAAAAAALLVFAAATHVLDSRRRGEDHAVWLEAALWARAHLPPDAVIGMTDCGLFGYLSDRRTVNLDGVINGYAYQEALHRHRLGRFLDRAGLTHVAASGARYVKGGYVMWLPARMHRGPGGALVGLEGGEIYRSRPYRGMRFVIWERDRVEVYDDALDARVRRYVAR